MPVVVRREALSSRERVRLALAHQETDRIPIAMVCSGINPPAYEALARYLRSERDISVADYLAPLIDIKVVAPQYIGPPLPAGEDVWGVRRKAVSYGAGAYDEIEYYPLGAAQTVGDLDAHRWPSTDWFDYTVLPERIAAAQDDGEHCLMVTNGNIFESSWYMRGFQQMFLDLVLNTALAHGILQRVTDFFCAHFQNMLSAGKGEIDLAFTADDIGSQRGPLLSREMWEDNLKPYHVRLNEAIHEHGAKVIYHSDGAVMWALEGLIDMGVDVLQALQFNAAGMDPAALKRQTGDRLCYEGGVSVQETLPFGTVEDVRQEVEELISVLGNIGGYILGPSHAIQAGTPPENIVAMFDTAASFYPYRTNNG
jgi:uroporphyrinogen decarboxylase